MVVRDEQGNILNPLHTSTIQLYKHHETATERIQNSHVRYLSKSYNWLILNVKIYLFLGCWDV